MSGGYTPSNHDLGVTTPPRQMHIRPVGTFLRIELFSVNYFGLLATIILAGSGATWTGVESMVMA